MEFNINILAVLAAVVANFFFGFIWYTPLFGKIWGREMGYDPNEPAKKSDMIKGMAFMVIGNFLMAWVLANNNMAWQFVPGINEMGPLARLLNATVFTWLGFYFPGDLGATVWEKKSWTMFAINSGYKFISLLIASTILTYWV
jgi:hypothetical protein